MKPSKNGDTDPEALAWINTDPEDLWVFDKLILARKLGYICGGMGVNVPKPDYYIVRPCVNLYGLGLGAKMEYLEQDTCHLPPGHFWCELFKGRHLSIDYQWGEQKLAVEGFKPEETFIQWNKWVQISVEVPFPKILDSFLSKYEWINCEFIGGKLIEIHFRRNPDFSYNNTEYIPVWQGQDSMPPTWEKLDTSEKYRFVEHIDELPKIGAFVNKL